MHSKRAPRRRHSDELKAQVLAACDEAGASVAAVAQAHNLNANLVHKWRRGRGAGAASPVLNMAPSSPFVALSLPAQMSAAPPAPPPVAVADIRVQIKRGATAVVVSWPTSAAADCAAWLREWLR